MKVAFLGRTVHERTGSDRFLIELLAEVADVRVWRREALHSAVLAREVNRYRPDAVVHFQSPPSFARQLLFLRARRHIWVPMYDGFKPLGWRKRWAYRLFKVECVCFCRKLHGYLRGIGLRSVPVQYFPRPNVRRAAKAGPPYKVFLWQRCSEIGIQSAVNALGEEQIAGLAHKGDAILDCPRAYGFGVEQLDRWLAPQALLQELVEADYVLAPRRQEGIGHSFLEAMATGAIVLACDDATMNEYIVNDRTGYLFDAPSFVPRHPVRPPAALLPELSAFCEAAHARWRADSERIRRLVVRGLPEEGRI